MTRVLFAAAAALAAAAVAAHPHHRADAEFNRRSHAALGRGAVQKIVRAAAEGYKAAGTADPRSRPVLAHLVTAALAPKVERFKAHRDSGRLRDVTVNTKYGSVTGLSSAAVNQFLGIPYATQPVGPLRWKQPQEPASWGSLNATWWGPGCLQSEAVWNIYTGSNEGVRVCACAHPPPAPAPFAFPPPLHLPQCLYLNIYTPTAAPPPGGYPVMFFMHGGSWVYGSGSFLLYDADEDGACSLRSVARARDDTAHSSGDLDRRSSPFADSVPSGSK